jgi:hypothetical protein
VTSVFQWNKTLLSLSLMIQTSKLERLSVFLTGKLEGLSVFGLDSYLRIRPGACTIKLCSAVIYRFS